jgi:hypothetical protein
LAFSVWEGKIIAQRSQRRIGEFFGIPNAALDLKASAHAKAKRAGQEITPAEPDETMSPEKYYLQ